MAEVKIIVGSYVRFVSDLTDGATKAFSSLLGSGFLKDVYTVVEIHKDVPLGGTEKKTQRTFSIRRIGRFKDVPKPLPVNAESKQRKGESGSLRDVSGVEFREEFEMAPSTHRPLENFSESYFTRVNPETVRRARGPGPKP